MFNLINVEAKSNGSFVAHCETCVGGAPVDLSFEDYGTLEQWLATSGVQTRKAVKKAERAQTREASKPVVQTDSTPNWRGNSQGSGAAYTAAQAGVSDEEWLYALAESGAELDELVDPQPSPMNSPEGFQTSTSYKLESGVITAVEVSSLRKTVGEYLGFERIVTLTVGHESDPAVIRDAIAKSPLARYEILALKDGKCYLSPKGALDNIKGDKAKSSIVEVLKRESHPAFNTLGTLKLMVADIATVDGAVIIYRGEDQITQIAFAKQFDQGLVGSKGTAVCHSEWLDAPEIPSGVDGYLNLQGMTLNGVKLAELSPNQLPAMLQPGSVLEIANLHDFWVALRTDLNIYKVGVPPMNAITWPVAAFQKWLELLVGQFKTLITRKSEAQTAKDVLKATEDHLRPFGCVEDFHNVCAKLGAYPESAEHVVEETFAVAGINLLRRGPVVRMAFGYVMPGKGLGRGEIVVPKEVLERANLLKRFEEGKTVYLESWRNPVLPGMQDNRITSAARFKVVGISQDWDWTFYVNAQDWLIMGGDFDGDRICVSLAKPFGLGSLCDAPLGVAKDKTNHAEIPGTDLLDRVLNASLRLGVLFNATVSVLDWCYILGIDPNEFGLLGAAAVQAAVVRQKHNPVWQFGNATYSSFPRQGERLLTFPVAKALLVAKASELQAHINETDRNGRTRCVVKSPSVQPASALKAYRFIKEAKKTLSGSVEVLNSLPNRSEGRMAEAVTWASRVPKAPMQELPIVEDYRFEVFIEEQLERRIGEATGIAAPNKRLTNLELSNLAHSLIAAQQKGSNAGDSPQDNTWGVKTFAMDWSKAMKGFNAAARLTSMSRLWDELTRRECNMFVRLNALGADYQIMRSLSVEIDTEWAKVWQPNPMELASRVASEEHAEESWEDFMSEL